MALEKFNRKTSLHSRGDAWMSPPSDFNKPFQYFQLLNQIHCLKKSNGSSCDYLETWILCLYMFVDGSPPTLCCVAAGPGPVPVDQVSLCLCLLPWLAWQKPINTTLPPLYLLFRLTRKKKTILAQPKHTRHYRLIWFLFSFSQFFPLFVEIPYIFGSRQCATQQFQTLCRVRLSYCVYRCN